MEKPGEFSFQAQVTAAVGAAMSLPLSWVAGESRQATLNTSFPIILGCFGTVHPDATVEFIPEKIPGQTKQATVYEVTTERAWAGVVTIEKESSNIQEVWSLKSMCIYKKARFIGFFNFLD